MKFMKSNFDSKNLYFSQILHHTHLAISADLVWIVITSYLLRGFSERVRKRKKGDKTHPFEDCCSEWCGGVIKY